MFSTDVVQGAIRESAVRHPERSEGLLGASFPSRRLQRVDRVLHLHHVFIIFRPALRFLTRPFPPGDFAARLLAAVILPPLLFLAILAAPPVHDGNLWMKSIWIKGPAAALVKRVLAEAARG